MLLMPSRRTFALSAVFIALSQTAFATTEDDLAELNVSSSADATATEQILHHLRDENHHRFRTQSKGNSAIGERYH